MKRTTNISAALVTAILTLGMAGQAAAIPNSGPSELEEGKTSSRLLSGVDHYRLQVSDTSNVTIKSRGMNTGGGRHSGMRAVLRDGNGHVVTQAGRAGEDFIISRQLSPGEYTIEVHANMLRGGNDSTNYYQLITHIK
ncbi:hypothetical protein [Halomonas sp. BC04]|uniref:hypothetical protein n=1 Tax=Halomonas sp. BC04 TaxID=1403540 RepID=UPI0012DE83D4|nr:hypothetical protein [Halomonas sp. BC04]